MIFLISTVSLTKATIRMVHLHIGHSSGLISRQCATNAWFRVFFAHLVMTLIIVASAIPLGLGLIWTLRWAGNLHGVRNREVIDS